MVIQYVTDEVYLKTSGFDVTFAELEDITQKQLNDCLVHELKPDVCSWPRKRDGKADIHEEVTS